jgi:hypothetical protein
VIAALAAAYAVSVGLFFPAFIRDMLPLVAAVYLPVRISLLVVLAWAIKCCVPPVFLLRIAEPSRRPDPMPLLLLLASAGFAIALVIQGKVWPYHVFPTLTLALLALIGGLVEAGLAGRVPLLAPRMLAAILGGGIILGYAAYLFSVHTHPALLIEEVRKLALTKPKILAVTSDISLGHPLTREVDGQWVDRYAAHWITMNADLILNDGRTLTPAGRAKVEAYVAADKAALIADIEQHQPDIILVEESWWKPWSDRTPDVSAALLAYRPIKTIEDTIIMQRREP